VELPTSWLFDDSSHFFLTIQDPPRRPVQLPRVVEELWRLEFDGIYNEGGSVVLVLHPQIIGRTSRVSMLEGLLTYMKAKSGTLVGTGREISRAARKYLQAA
jgi:hypothetical protein